ncbi:MAG: PqqD family protein [Chloroflexota bacterium]
MSSTSVKSSMLERYPRRDGLYKILPDAVAVFDRYQKRIVRLDALGSEIWLRMDGLTRLQDIAADIAGLRGRPLNDVLRDATAMTGILIGEGLVHLSLAPEPLPYHLALPREEQDPVQAAESMRAAGWTQDES